MVLYHLVRLGALREVNLSVYVDFERWNDYTSEKTKIERNFRAVLKTSIYLNWLKFTRLDGWIANENEK